MHIRGHRGQTIQVILLSHTKRTGFRCFHFEREVRALRTFLTWARKRLWYTVARVTRAKHLNQTCTCYTARTINCEKWKIIFRFHAFESETQGLHCFVERILRQRPRVCLQQNIHSFFSFALSVKPPLFINHLLNAVEWSFFCRRKKQPTDHSSWRRATNLISTDAWQCLQSERILRL